MWCCGTPPKNDDGPYQQDAPSPSSTKGVALGGPKGVVQKPPPVGFAEVVKPEPASFKANVTQEETCTSSVPPETVSPDVIAMNLGRVISQREKAAPPGPPNMALVQDLLRPSDIDLLKPNEPNEEYHDIIHSSADMLATSTSLVSNLQSSTVGSCTSQWDFVMQSTDVPVPVKAATAEWQARQQGFIVKAGEEQGLLADLRLLEQLGKGAFGICFRGLWRGGVSVAAKVMLKKAVALGDTNQAGVPGLAAIESVVAKNLTHPNIVQCFHVRCSFLTSTFLASVLFGDLDLPELMVALTGWAPTVNIQLPNAEQMACEVLDLVHSWQGSTRLFPDHFVHQSKEMLDLADSARHTYQTSSPWNSEDGFGPAEEMASCMSWREVLSTMAPSPGDFCSVLLMVYCDCGTLEDAVISGVFKFSNGEKSVAGSNSDERRRLRALLRTTKEIAQALDHLHVNQVVHGDLKPANVLLDSSRVDTRGFVARLADFGLSTIVEDPHGRLGFSGGTVQYMAPELFKEGRCSYKSDIYALGIMIWAMHVRRCPYAGMRPNQICQAVCQGLRPVWPEGPLDDLAKLYHKCVTQEPAERPSASEVVQALVQLDDAVRRAARLKQQQQRSPQMDNSATRLEKAAAAARLLASALHLPQIPATTRTTASTAQTPPTHQAIRAALARASPPPPPFHHVPRTSSIERQLPSPTMAGLGSRAPVVHEPPPSRHVDGLQWL